MNSANTDEGQNKADSRHSSILPDVSPPAMLDTPEHSPSPHESTASPEAQDQFVPDPDPRMEQQEPDPDGGNALLEPENSPVLNSPPLSTLHEPAILNHGETHSHDLFMITTAEVKQDPPTPALFPTPPAQVYEELIEEPQPTMAVDEIPASHTEYQAPHIPSEGVDHTVQEAPPWNEQPELVNPALARVHPPYSYLRGLRDTSPDLPPLTTSLPQKRIIIPAPTSSFSTPSFSFELTPPATKSSTAPPSPAQHRHHFNPNYTLPSLKALPVEFNRKGKSSKQRKRERERDKVDGQKNRDLVKDDWYPMGLSRWVATINANPVWKRVSRASKCLSSRDWAVGTFRPHFLTQGSTF